MIFKFALLLLSILCTLSPGLEAARPKEKGKVALLFLTNAHPNHPKLWQTLLEASDNYNVYIHSKDPISIPFFQQYRIDTIVSTSWSIHVRAWQVLIQAALKNPENQWFAFLSESCIPLYSLDRIYKSILDDPSSHIAFAGPWWPTYSPREIQELYPEFRMGNHEWMLLNRKHAEIVAQDRAIIRIISKHPNDQESYFGCLFAVYNCLHEICNHTHTYINWKYAEDAGCHPYTFRAVNAFNDALIAEAYASRALFARKFSKDYPEDVLLKMIYDHSK